MGTEARGEFSETERSINATGETLPAKVCEFGVTHLACGINDQILFSAPTFTTLTGRSEMELRGKWIPINRFRVAPSFILGTPTQIATALNLGVDLGEKAQHSLTVGLEARFLARTDVPLQESDTFHEFRTKYTPSFGYDFYFSGNDLYFGVLQRLPYFGITLSSGNFYYGIVTTPLSKFIPLPYAYLRF